MSSFCGLVLTKKMCFNWGQCIFLWMFHFTLLNITLIYELECLKIGVTMDVNRGLINNNVLKLCTKAYIKRFLFANKHLYNNILTGVCELIQIILLSKIEGFTFLFVLSIYYRIEQRRI